MSKKMNAGIVPCRHMRWTSTLTRCTLPVMNSCCPAWPRVEGRHEALEGPQHVRRTNPDAYPVLHVLRNRLSRQVE